MRVFLVAAALAALAVPAAADQQKVGVAAAVNPDTLGQPPSEPVRALIVGNDIMHMERISTQNMGQAQILFVDQSSITVAPNSELVIDDFVYDPSKNSGHMAATLSKGLMRYVGGKISKESDVTIKTPSSVIAIRGGIGFVRDDEVDPNIVVATFLYGLHMCVTAGGVTKCVYKPGYSIRVDGLNLPPGDPVPFSHHDIDFKVWAMEGHGDQDVPPIHWLDFPLGFFAFWTPAYQPGNTQTSQPPPTALPTSASGWSGYLGGLENSHIPGCGTGTDACLASSVLLKPLTTTSGPSFVGTTTQLDASKQAMFSFPGSGPFSAEFTYDSALGTALYEFGDSVGSSFFHNDNKFGANGVAESLDGNTITSSKLYLISSNANGAPVYTGEPLSNNVVHWGFWSESVTISDGTKLSDLSATCIGDVAGEGCGKLPLFWVAGTQASAADFAKLTGTKFYTGNMIGDVNSAVFGKYVATGDLYDVTYNFNPAKETGHISFDFDGVSYNGKITAVPTDTMDFTGKFHSIGSCDGSICLKGTLAGSFYGTSSDPASSAGGNFQIMGRYSCGECCDGCTMVSNAGTGGGGSKYIASGIFTLMQGKAIPGVTAALPKITTSSLTAFNVGQIPTATGNKQLLKGSR